MPKVSIKLVQGYPDNFYDICCWIATLNLIMLRGFDPENSADKIYKQRWDAMQEKIRRAQIDRYVFARIIDSSSGAQEGEILSPAAPSVVSPAPYHACGGSPCETAVTTLRPI